MSINWLLSKITNIKTSKKASDVGHERDKLSGDNGRPLPVEQPHGTKGRNENLRPQDTHLWNPKPYSRHCKVALRCDCSYEGTGTRNKSDLVFAGKGRNEYAYFECPRCGRTLRYDCLTGETTVKKGLRGALLGNFS